MCSDEPSGSKFKQVCTYLPNLAVLTNRATHFYIQVAYAHASVGNNSLGKKVTVFALTGYHEAPTVVSIDIEHAFAGDGKRIYLPTT